MEAAHDGPSDAAGLVAPVGEGIVGKCCDWQECRKPFKPREQKNRFCSRECKDAWFNLHRPRVDSPIAGAPRTDAIWKLVLGVLGDGEWHSVQDLATKTHALPCSVSARIRNLRSRGHRIERDLKVGNTKRPARYRLISTGQP